MSVKYRVGGLAVLTLLLALLWTGLPAGQARADLVP